MRAMRIESHPLSIVCVMETLEVLRQDGIVTVTMNRPSKKNAANGTMWAELKQTFLEIGSNPDDRVMVLTGAGGEFCSGADLSGGSRMPSTSGGRWCESYHAPSKACAMRNSTMA